jgi:hypothetical protein
VADESPAKPAEKKPADPPARGRIVIRGYPKTVYFYPTAIVALACALLEKAGLVTEHALGFVFMVVFVFNLVVTSFEFRKHTPVVLALLAVTSVLALVLLDERFGIVGMAGALYSRIHLVANPSFYFAVAFGFALIFAGIFVASRFEYWEVRGNELLHHTGLLGDTERYPAQALRIKKEITDVFEFLLLSSGRIVIYPSRTDRPIVIENVPRVNDIADRMEAVLDSMRVDVEGDG